jgi:hypothetical protein
MLPPVAVLSIGQWVFIAYLVAAHLDLAMGRNNLSLVGFEFFCVITVMVIFMTGLRLLRKDVGD